MACSYMEYVKEFERDTILLPNCWIIVRIDGRGFSKFCNIHGLDKPNDKSLIHLFNYCALITLTEFPDIILAYGQSDEYSKLVSVLLSFFSSNFVYYWNFLFTTTPLKSIPCFDGRVVLYPSFSNIKDYFCWRQADCHINCLFNTCFWKLVESGYSKKDAFKRLEFTQAKDKNELLFSQYNMNYNDIDPMYRKGTIIYRKNKKDNQIENDSYISFFKNQIDNSLQNLSPELNTGHCSFFDNDFWQKTTIDFNNS